MYKICHNFSDLNFYNFFCIATLIIICINTTGPFSFSLILNTIGPKISSPTVCRMFGINSFKILYLLQAYLVLKNLTSTTVLHLYTEYYILFVESCFDLFNQQFDLFLSVSLFFSSSISVLVCVQSTMVLYFQINKKINLNQEFSLF